MKFMETGPVSMPKRELLHIPTPTETRANSLYLEYLTELELTSI